ncbi:MAG: hypothetical protein IJ762_00005 [Bacteroidaceae bacterium]|nr:hypothetical protein [Bacteroidaceae bacterium]
MNKKHEKAFEIVTNAMGRRVLVIRQYTEELEKLKYEDSDIVFFDVVGLPSNEKRLLLQVTSPMLTKSYWLKPRFSKTPEQKIMGYIQNLVDGFANSPLDDMVTNKAEEILQRTAELRIEPMLEGLSTEVTFYISLCKYALSRGMTRLNSTIVPSLTLGITAVYAGMMSNAEITYRENQKFRRSELIEFNHRLLELDYTEYVRHVERIHLCPNCQSSHLIFAECCPKCESSHILQEPMIHHFRCANVSPESTYSYDGELRCPKCRHRLRHIGVDYDRPTDTYSCQECGHTFLHSEILLSAKHTHPHPNSL